MFPSVFMASKEQARLYFNYTKKFKEHHIGIAKEIAKVSKIKKDDSILEIGVGTGASTKIFLEKLGKKGVLDGLDHSRNMMYYFKNDVKSDKIRKVITGDAKNINIHFRDNQYDKILCSNSFWAIEDIDDFMDGVSNLLKKEGRLVFSIYGTRIVDYGIKRIKELLKKYNMKLIKDETKQIFIRKTEEAKRYFYQIKAKKIKKLADPKRRRKAKEEWKKVSEYGIKVERIGKDDCCPVLICSATNR